MSMFSALEFRFAVHQVSDMPPDIGAEVAFAGRSNAGKSTAINVLANRRKLAFVSKSPGRTQALIFFDMGEQRYLVDLPGYGYAAVPGKEQVRWNELISAYLKTRNALKLLILVADARQGITVLDHHLLDWLSPGKTPVHVLLTKSDKLTKSQLKEALDKATMALARHGIEISIQIFSGLRRSGVQEAQSVIAKRLLNKKPPVKGD